MLFFRLGFLWLLLEIPAAGWASASKPPTRQYVILSDSLGALHHVKAQRGGRQFDGLSASDAGQRTVTVTIPNTRVEIFNLLIPGSRVKRLLSSQKSGKNTAVFLNSDTLLITTTVLPAANGEVSWQLVQLDTIQSDYLRSLTTLVQNASERIAAYRQAGSPGSHSLLCQDNIIPLVQHQGQYWAPINAYVLTEYFQIRHQPSHSFSSTDLATINIQARPARKEALLREKRQQSGNLHAQLTAVPAGNALQGQYRGRYQFWSNPSEVLSHPNILHYGSSDFYYQPGIGIVSSTYQYYFQNLSSQYDWNEPFEVISIDGKPVK